MLEQTSFNVRKLILAGDQGTCGGVRMADQATREVLARVDRRRPVVTLWDVINNVPYMEEMRSLGLTSLEDLIPDKQKSPDLLANMRAYLPTQAVVILPAHGSYPKLYDIIQEKDCLPIDVTCQLVSTVQRGAEKAVDKGIWPVYGGVENHPETNSVIKRLPEGSFTFVDVRKINAMESGERDDYLSGLGIPDDQPIVLLDQTTLSPADVKQLATWLKNRFPKMIPPTRVLNNICPAMENRWNSVAEMTESGMIDLLLVTGSQHSHNSQELRKKGEQDVLHAYSVDRPDEIDLRWFTKAITRVGLTAGASVFPNVLDPVKNWFIQQNPDIQVVQLKGKEDRSQVFVLPKKQLDNIEAFIQRAA
ncbi:MAG: hypothetical protein Q7R49_06955 [Candidatus Daviesbacteria bacterium]|nr:hypothetical protein [Candidatus Daviesbacteria bacterium]